MSKGNKKYTIGLLVSGIMDNFTETVCKGVIQALKNSDVDANLIVLPGAYLDRDLTQFKEITYEYQYNTLFSYAQKENVDALIVSAGSIGCFTTEKRVRELLSNYDGIPCVLVASKIDGYVSVNYDNYQGIKDGLEYLIKNMNCKKFGMVCGPKNNVDAYERKQAFIEILKENGINTEEKNFVEGDFSRNSNEEYSKLLDNNPDMEAVFCVNDLSALGFYDEMKKRRLRPGKDIYVFGYDNTLIGAHSKPSLTSVWSDPIALGERALKNVLKMLEGEKIESEVMPTKLIKRNSFGEASEDNANTLSYLLDENYIQNHFEDIFYRYMHGYMNEEISSARELFVGIIHSISSYCFSDLITDENEISDSVDAFINNGFLQYADIDNLIIYLDQISSAIKSEISDLERKYKLLDVFDDIYHKIIFDMDHRFGTLRRNSEDTWFAMKMFVRDILQFERGNDQSYAVLLENLDWLDIKRAYVYTFKKAITYLNGEKFVPPDVMYMKAMLRDGKAQSIPATRQKKSVSDMFDYSYIDDSQYFMVMLPLFFNEILYGVVVCDLTDRLFFDGEFLTNQMSSAVKMIGLLNTNEVIQQQLEGSLSTLREHNIALDNLSKSDALTGIYNRRGFYKAAGIFVEQNQVLDKYTIVAYVDMNNLKIINDRYGHEEGDFSLKLIGQILSDIMNNKGIIGRIGGDEFAFVMEYNTEEQELSLLNEIKDGFERYNMGSDKPYNITVSVGSYILKPDDKFSLKEALTFADEQMYEMKKIRKKQVAKGETNSEC